MASATKLERMFFLASSFNQDIDSWEVSKVVTFSSTFSFASSFNQDLSSWNVASATILNGMFRGATAFDQDISGWITSTATDFGFMFRDATAFDQDLSSWITSSGESFTYMFNGATAFNQDLSSWKFGALACDFSTMFDGATTFNQNLNSWEPQLLGNDCSGVAPNVADMFTGSACPIQTATLPGDFCQAAPSATPSSAPKVPPFKVRKCLEDAAKSCSCKKKSKKSCLTVLRTACKAKSVAAGGSPSRFASLSRAARQRKCG
jgi:hypothetical protein